MYHSLPVHINYTQFKSFIQDVNIEKLCSSFISIVHEGAPAMLQDAKMVKTKFEKLFQLFASCHEVYDSKKMMTTDILTQLGIYASL